MSEGDEAAMEPQQEDGTRRPTTRTHTITRAAIVFFSGFFYEAVVQHVTYVTDFCRVCRLFVFPNDPPQFSIFRHRRSSCAATRQIAREGRAIIDICIVVFGSIALVSLHARGSSL